jgi:hypothetical protein
VYLRNYEARTVKITVMEPVHSQGETGKRASRPIGLGGGSHLEFRL